MNRPAVGSTVTTIIHISVCRGCGHEVDNTLCDYHCKFDGDTRTNENTFFARYERVDKFLGDVEYSASIKT